MPPCHGGGRGFEPRPDRHFGSVAQSVEQRTENPRVAGSIPALGILNAEGCLEKNLAFKM